MADSTAKILADLMARIEQVAVREKQSPEELAYQAVEEHLQWGAGAQTPHQGRRRRRDHLRKA